MVTGGPASRSTTGHGYKSGQCTKLIFKVPECLPAVAQSNHSSCEQTHEHFTTAVHECADCGYMFKGKQDMWHHNRTVHAGKRFLCPQCQRTFAYQSGLNQHVKHVHQKLNRYQCETCGKGYLHRSNYHDHVAAHTGVKRHVCSICLKLFTFKHGLKAHVLRFHPNEVAHM